jgi:multiple sugar transport system permease protein
MILGVTVMRTKIKNSLLFSLLLSITTIFMLPIMIIVTNSFMSSFEVVTRYSQIFTPANSFGQHSMVNFVEFSLIPNMVTLKQYISFFFDTPLYIGLFFNSLIITAPIVIGQIIIAVPAAYAFELSRYQFKEPLFFIYIIIMLLPLQVTLVPNFIVAEWLNINGTYWAIILPAVFNPFGVFLIRQFMKGIPKDYIEASKVDGAGHLRIFSLVISPLLKPAIAALALLTFVEYWNMVDQALVFINDEVEEPLSVFLSRMTDGTGMGVIFAASVFYMMPAVILFLMGRNYMFEGIRMSGIR